MLLRDVSVSCTLITGKVTTYIIQLYEEPQKEFVETSKLWRSRLQKAGGIASWPSLMRIPLYYQRSGV